MKELLLIIVPLLAAGIAAIWRQERTRPWFLPVTGLAHAFLAFWLMLRPPATPFHAWLGYDPLARAMLPHLVDGGDAGMREARQQPRLALEPLQVGAVAAVAGGHRLDRDLAPQARVARAVDAAHAADTDQLDDLVAAEAVARRERRCLRLALELVGHLVERTLEGAIRPQRVVFLLGQLHELLEARAQLLVLATDLPQPARPLALRLVEGGVEQFVQPRPVGPLEHRPQLPSAGACSSARSQARARIQPRCTVRSDDLTAQLEETYLAEQDGELLGMLTIGGCRDEDVNPQITGEIWGIYLAPQYWRQGIGRTLCRYGEGLLSRRGYQIATLWVFAGNAQARRFYEAMGYTTDGASQVRDFGVPLEVIRYRKSLTPEGG